MSHIYGIGETVYDIIFRDDQPQRAVPGGSTFNAIISLGRCGLHPTMVTETGDDHVGEIITSFMAANGVATNGVTINAGTKTHISLAFLDANDDAHYQFYKDHASARVEPRFPDFKADDIVIFGSFFAVNPAIRDYTREFLQRAHDAGAILYYDVNFRAAHIADLPRVKENIEENMRLASIVRASDEDLLCVYGEEIAVNGDKSFDISEVYRSKIAPLCPFYICTKGPRGVDVFTPDGQQHHYPTTPLETVSTIGAGDNFNAGVCQCLAAKHISNEVLRKPTEDVLEAIVATGQAFAAEVCQSLDNYISPDFARKYRPASELPDVGVYLFDLDGVVIDTEGQYQRFWGSIGREFLPEIPDFATRIKGSTLVAIHDNYFAHDAALREEIDRRLIEFEDQMIYELFDGAADFIRAAASRGIRCAIVTSSNQQKMQSLAAQLPHLTSLFDHVFTAEDAGRGKPYPDCYIRAARHYGLEASECVVFEDSINGLKAARASGAFVVGLTTTHPRDLVEQYADVVTDSLKSLL